MHLDHYTRADEVTELCGAFKHLNGYQNLGSTLSSKGYSALGKLTQLERVSLVHINVNTQATTEVGKLTNLTLLGILQCDLTDADLAPLIGLAKLRDLRLQETKIRGSGLSNLIANSATLKKLALDRALIDDRGLATIAKFPEVIELTLAETQVTDAGLSQLLQLHKLKRLRLTASKVTQAGVDQFRAQFAKQNKDSARPGERLGFGPSRPGINIEFVAPVSPQLPDAHSP